MSNHTYYKTPDGRMYGVSKRVMDMGYSPNEGVVLADEEDITAFQNRALAARQASSITTSNERIRFAKEMFESGTLTADAIKTLTGLDVHNLPEPEPVVEIEPEPKVESLDLVVETEPVVEDLNPSRAERRAARLKERAEATVEEEQVVTTPLSKEEQIERFKNLKAGLFRGNL